MLMSCPPQSSLRYAARLRATPWTIVIRNAWLAFLAITFGGMLLPHDWAHAARSLLLSVPLLMLAAKDLSHLPDALARTRVALAGRRWRDLPAAWLPPEVVGFMRLGHALRCGFVQWLLRRPQPAAPAGTPFGYLQRGAYPTGVAIVLFSTLFELPLDAAVLPLLVKDPALCRTVHWLMLAGCLSSLVWVLGDRRLVGAGAHVLDAAALQVRIGARTHGTIPRTAVARCERVREPAAAWCRRHGIAPAAALTASPLDKPNLVLILQDGHDAHLTHLGVRRAHLAAVFLYVDDPDALAAALTAR